MSSNHNNEPVIEPVTEPDIEPEFNVNDIYFSKIAPYGTSGSKVINVFDSKTRSSLAYATPVIYTYGTQQVRNEAKELIPNKWTMALAFPDETRATPELSKCLQDMKDIYNYIKSEALKRPEEWFGREKISQDAVDEIFNPMLRYPPLTKGSLRRDYSKPPTLPVKIPFWEKTGKWPTQVFDDKCMPLFVHETCPGHTPIEYLPKGKERGGIGGSIICMLTCGGIWIANGKFSITWNVQEVVIPKSAESTRGICTISSALVANAKFPAPGDEQSNNDDSDPTIAQAPMGKDDSKVDATIVDDSEDEDEGEDIDDPPAVIVAEEPVAVSKPVVAEEPVAVIPAAKPARRRRTPGTATPVS